jgi:hypothetical protein
MILILILIYKHFETLLPKTRIVAVITITQYPKKKKNTNPFLFLSFVLFCYIFSGTKQYPEIIAISFLISNLLISIYTNNLLIFAVITNAHYPKKRYKETQMI